MGPLISVIVPIYNVEPYLRACVQSILDQTWRELEIILVDDGSTDGSGALCDRFAAGDGRVRVIHQENSGTASGARNAGIEAATGQWFTFVDGDDFLDRDMIEYLYRLCESTGSQISRCGVRHVGFPVSKDIPGGDEDYAVYDGREAAEYVLLEMKDFTGSAAHTLFRADVVRQLRFREVRCREDQEYTFLAVFGCERVCCSRAPKYNYVWRSGNSASSPLLSKLSELDAVIGDMRRFAQSNAPQLLPAVDFRFADNALTFILEPAARARLTAEERTAMLALRQRVLRTRFDAGRLSRTSRLWYGALRLGMGPFTAVCRAVYACKIERTKIRERLRQK